jgi:hypothetical protein
VRERERAREREEGEGKGARKRKRIMGERSREAWEQWGGGRERGASARESCTVSDRTGIKEEYRKTPGETL